MADIERLTAAGEKLGYSGAELRTFVNEHLEREDKHRQQEEERQERALVREERRRADELAAKKLEIELLTLQNQNQEVGGQSRQRGTSAKAPKLPLFQEAKDDLDAYIGRFEHYAEAQKWPRGDWATNFSALLTGKALEVYYRLPTDKSNDYEALKDALLERFHLTEEGFRNKFFDARAEESESAKQYRARLENYFGRWMQLAGAERTFDDLWELMVRERFISSCHRDLMTFLREKKLKKLDDVVTAANNYRDAHGGNLSNIGRFSRDHTKQGQERQTPASCSHDEVNRRRYFEDRTCYRCGQKGHIATNCRQTESEATHSKTYQAATHREFRECFICGKRGHIAKDCRGNYDRSYERPSQKSGAVWTNPESETANNTSPSCTLGRQNDRSEGAGTDGEYSCQCLDKESHPSACKIHTTTACSNLCRCKEKLPVCLVKELGEIEKNSLALEIEDGFGVKHPLCHMLCDKPIPICVCGELPTISGFVNQYQATVMRDTGCSGVVVKSGYVDTSQYTGKYKVCLLVDGTTRKVPTAIVHLDCPFYTGTVEAMVMPTLLFDVVLGNITGARAPDQPDREWKRESIETAQSVMTRAQVQKTKQNTTPLKVPELLEAPTPKQQKLAEEQKEDPTLSRINKLLEEKAGPKVTKAGESWFERRHGILYRFHQNKNQPTKPAVKQLVVPKNRRTQVLQLAHEGIMGGHMGIQKTTDKVLTNFYWPGLQGDVSRYCQSCDICQRTLPKGKTPRVPLDQMPMVDTPFQRIAVDIIGPISPVSDQGNRYILTVVDYATRYPEAKALKNIDTETVAEALLEIYSRMGFPEEILTDRGTQFTSDMMREINRLISIRQLTTTPYHPICNGLVEKFNGTLKLILKRLCSEQPMLWDRFLPATLFAYREVPQESLGFAPFELLYGRTVRGPLNILRTIWTKEIKETQLENSYQYVLDLKGRIEETCRIAREELRKASCRYKKAYDKRARPRSMRVGDQALILLPTDCNKLTMQWKGPFRVIGQVAKYDYMLDVNGKNRTFHLNILKKYHPREKAITDDSTEVVHGDLISIVAANIVEETEEGTEGDLHLLEVNLPESNETYLDVQYADTLTPVQLQEAKDLVFEYRDLFTDLPGTTNLAEHKIDLTTDEPIRQKPYPLPYATRERVKEEIEKMLEMGVIERSESPYAAPVVLVKKPDGSIRFCIDFRRLNRVTVFDSEPMTSADDIFAKLQGDRYFTKIDLSKGYWQVPIRDEDKPKTAFVTQDGCYQFCKMPFGLVNATATFNRMMRKATRQIDHLDSFVDDILGHTENWMDHLLVLRKVFDHLRQGHLTIRPTKCFIGFHSLIFVGHKIGDGTLCPHPDKVDEICQAPRPVTKKQVRSFLGLVGYYRAYIPNFAAIATPLTDLTKKGHPNVVVWGEVEERAFQNLKKAVTKDPILKVPDFTKTFVVQTDASNIAAGAALLQEHDGLKFPVAYASRKFSNAEKAYSVIEKECLALVWALQKFQTYLYGREFIVETDHQPLAYIESAKLANSRIMRWALLLQNFRFTIRAIPGRENMVADYLSRAVSTEV